MNIIDLGALTLVGPTGTSLVPDPLAVLHLDNGQFMNALLYLLNLFASRGMER